MTILHSSSVFHDPKGQHLFPRPNLVTHLSIKSMPSQSSALLCLPLRQQIVGIVQQLHRIALDETLLIREAVPLNAIMDHPAHYLSCANYPPATADNSNEPLTLLTIRVT